MLRAGSRKGDVARQELAAVVGGQRIKGAAGTFKSGGTRLGLGEEAAQVRGTSLTARRPVLRSG